MLITLLVWLYLFAICLVYGNEVFKQILLILGHDFLEKQTHIALRILLGMVFLAVVGMWLSLLLPLGGLVNLFIFLGFIFLLWRNWSSYRLLLIKPSISSFSRKKLGFYLVLLMVFAFALISSTAKAINPDTLLYHIQTIRWVETYPAVPGLANLHSRLAFNSSWLLLNALFSYSFLLGQSLHTLLGFLFFMCSWYFLDGFLEFSENKSIVGLFRLSLLPMAIYISKSELSSPGTDVPAILFLWIGVALYWDSLSADRSFSNVYLALAVIISFFAVTVKLSVLPVLIIPILASLQNLANRRFWLILFFLTLFIFSPWLGRNAILSGYLVYPFPTLDVFSFDWKVPPSQVTETRDGILAFARMPGEPTEYVTNLPFSKWVGFWFANLSPFRRVVFVTSLLSPVIFGLRRFLKPMVNKDLQILYVSIYFGLLYWFITAPAFRFGFGFISVVLLFILFMFFDIKSAGLGRLFSGAVLAFCLLYPTYLLGLSLPSQNIQERLFFPVQYESPETKACYIDGKELNCAKIYGWCGYESFPCALKIRMDLSLRGSDWDQGFRSTAP